MNSPPPSDKAGCIMRFGAFEVDPETEEFRKHGILIRLSHQPFQALLLLIEHPGEVVSRQQLRTVLWQDEAWGDHDLRLNKVINKLREALGDNSISPRYIDTVPRAGYRFLGAVERIPKQPESGQAIAAATVSPSPSLVPAPPGSADPDLPKPWQRSARVLSLITVLLGCCLVLVLLRPWQADSSRTAHANPVTPPVPLTTLPGAADSPAYSPDGQQVVFTWDNEGQTAPQIYVIPANGIRGPERLTHDQHADRMPEWSPDGSRIAFLREYPDSHVEVRVIDLATRREHAIGDAGPQITGDHPISWARDSSAVVVSMRESADDPPALFVLSVRNGRRWRLTSPAASAGGDVNPAVSPDGTKVAFARGIEAFRLESSRDIYVVSLSPDLVAAGEPVRVTKLPLVANTIAWTPDGRELVYSAVTGAFAIQRLFRIPAEPLATDLPAADLGIEGAAPAVSPDGKRLLYVRESVQQTAIVHATPHAAGPFSGFRRIRLVSSTRRDFCPDLSPDGKRVAFASVRSGSLEVWIANSDGSGLKRITWSGAVTPTWSPDGKRLAFVAGMFSPQHVFTYDVASGAVRQITSEPPRNVYPTWSVDGKSIYFSSLQTGKWQIFRAPSDGGPAVQLTHGGGLYAVEWQDGNVYYVSADTPHDIRRVPAQGGDETVVVHGAMPQLSALRAGRGGLFYFSDLNHSGAQLSYYSFAARINRPVLKIEHPVDRIFSSDPASGGVTYVQTERWNSDIMSASFERRPPIT